jgi:hypothetical protein
VASMYPRAERRLRPQRAAGQASPALAAAVSVEAGEEAVFVVEAVVEDSAVAAVVAAEAGGVLTSP